MGYTKEEIESMIRFIVADKTWSHEDDVKEDSLLKDELGADSLDIVDIVMTIERDFDIQIPDSELDALGSKTVGDLCRFVEQKVNNK